MVVFSCYTAIREAHHSWESCSKPHTVPSNAGFEHCSQCNGGFLEWGPKSIQAIGHFDQENMFQTHADRKESPFLVCFHAFFSRTSPSCRQFSNTDASQIMFNLLIQFFHVLAGRFSIFRQIQSSFCLCQVYTLHIISYIPLLSHYKNDEVSVLSWGVPSMIQSLWKTSVFTVFHLW